MKEKREEDKKEYQDIIDLPHHVSRKRPRMSRKDRAAQFSPFAAVVGHEEAIKETARRTDQRKELDEMEKAIIDGQLREIEAQLPHGSDLEIVYFQPDQRKSGGTYVVKRGRVKRFDSYLNEVQMTDGTRIRISEISRISRDSSNVHGSNQGNQTDFSGE